MRISRLSVLVCISLGTYLPIGATAQFTVPPCEPTVTGQVDLVPSVSRVFHNQRYLRVWVPSGYSDFANADRRYPVLYVMDGDLLFGDCPYGMKNPDWGFDETLTTLIAKGAIPPMIVIGIDSVAREYELLPYRDPFFLRNSPEPIGRQFPEFLAQDIIPLITTRYRITPGPQAIAGWSYGAIAALWALIARPDLFNAGLLESPSLGVGNGQLLRDTDHLLVGPQKVFIGAGDSEFSSADGNRGYLNALELLERHLAAALQTRSQVKRVISPGATHSITASSQRLEQALLSLFGG